MRRFVALFEMLDATKATNAKLEALREYFAAAPPADAAWAVYFLIGRRLKRLIGPARLKRWLVEQTGLPAWLVEASHQHVGDLAETIACCRPVLPHRCRRSPSPSGRNSDCYRSRRRTRQLRQRSSPAGGRRCRRPPACW